jgi:hypothetical protein
MRSRRPAGAAPRGGRRSVATGRRAAAAETPAAARARLLRRLDAAWVALRASYAGLSNGQLTTPGVTGDWSVRDILAHVSTWEGEALTHLPVIAAGGRPPRYVRYGGIDAFNAKRHEETRRLSLPAVLRRLDHTHRRLVRLVQRTPAARLARDARWRRRLRLDTYGHYSEHTRAIRTWRARLGA